ncbi:XRE family transcriptional regulator [Terasakiella sp. A23]|uniref:helix-turn-helix domain-containing protein n=1 Tax=Terasakiella sp. FCG-A23 TaxID=3080561 RepID=UPI002955C020|nr:XRE family transcriptional regulator [Terasakiella sp. A23]MDV7338189.1 XRE family transcriptional regulator [Terasakiella sp. A23]
MDKPSVNTLGRHLQKLRQQRDISLSQLASAAGIAKSNLSRIEQGSGNPTLDTIWRLAIQLKVPFSTLIAPISGPISDNDVEVRLIDHGTDNPEVDVYWMSCAPNTIRQAEGHSPGTIESITMISGELEVGALENIRTLRAGESHSFAADQPHIYRAGDGWATLMLTIVYETKEDEA